ASDGGIFSFSDKPFAGSLGAPPSDRLGRVRERKPADAERVRSVTSHRQALTRVLTSPSRTRPARPATSHGRSARADARRSRSWPKPRHAGHSTPREPPRPPPAG